MSEPDEEDPTGSYTLTVEISNRIRDELQALVDTGYYGRDTSDAAARILARSFESRIARADVEGLLRTLRGGQA